MQFNMHLNTSKVTEMTHDFFAWSTSHGNFKAGGHQHGADRRGFYGNWYLEACRRLRGLGLRQHLLHPCCLLVFEKDFGVTEFSPGAVGDCGLVGIICLHMETFTFREWHDGDSLTYCDADIQRYADGMKLHHTRRSSP